MAPGGVQSNKSSDEIAVLRTLMARISRTFLQHFSKASADRNAVENCGWRASCQHWELLQHLFSHQWGYKMANMVI